MLTETQNQIIDAAIVDDRREVEAAAQARAIRKYYVLDAESRAIVSCHRTLAAARKAQNAYDPTGHSSRVVDTDDLTCRWCGSHTTPKVGDHARLDRVCSACDVDD